MHWATARVLQFLNHSFAFAILAPLVDARDCSNADVAATKGRELDRGHSLVVHSDANH